MTKIHYIVYLVIFTASLEYAWQDSKFKKILSNFPLYFFEIADLRVLINIENYIFW
jgi:hypothetical protein